MSSPTTSTTSTTSKKPQSTSPTTMSSASDKKNPSSNADTKQYDHKTVTVEELERWSREAREEYAKMSPEEREKICPWLRHYKDWTPTPAGELDEDFWDEI
ncbi:hypothetical protein F5Y05DRAFT_38353 [Hypoxylon sp. FL0543]|nr:hypothetical protein F5Y05DRAFT_38353 [Hypoxylon sp. FL0543]